MGKDKNCRIEKVLSFEGGKVMEELIKLNVQKVYGDFKFDLGKRVELLSNINFSIKVNETIMLAGPAGMGKSTLLTLLRSRHKNNFFGTLLTGVKYDGTVEKAEDLKIRFCSQALSINKGEILSEALEYEVKRNHANDRVSDQEIDSETDYWLGVFNIRQRKNLKIEKLSGGQQRRAMVAERCAFNSDFQVLLADEPDTGLDVLSQERLHGILCNVAKEENKALITVSHNVLNAYHYDKLLLLGRGMTKDTATIRYFDAPSKLMHKFGTDDFVAIFKELEKPIIKSVPVHRMSTERVHSMSA